VTTTGQGAKEFPEKMIRDIYDLRIDLSNMRKEIEKNEQMLLSYSSQEVILYLNSKSYNIYDFELQIN